MSAISKEMSSVIKQEWNPLSNVLIHWDDKTMSSMDGKKENEKKRLQVCSSIWLRANKNAWCFWLGKVLKKTYGRQVTDTIVKLLDEWKCQAQAYGMVFDTIASTTGCKTGAA
jgi:hypothetical protein